jgi:hypothetical protein
MGCFRVWRRETQGREEGAGYSAPQARYGFARRTFVLDTILPGSKVGMESA